MTLKLTFQTQTSYLVVNIDIGSKLLPYDI